ncbi:glycosyltransferase family 2 protein [Flavobacterium sp.]|uniref:glycosyltransferase family 2 protein n=1 Tax=Flavobacterium sp. TaxID=239 RepID=UPI00261E9804|nr:glycosyltransferase family 2 protein [Flavobacterium sp.]MDD3003990.1 glycosyltransferase family 2 protein [Flavobacterium sp.]
MINIQKNLISIIIPYYNSEMFLERTIQSIQNQTYSNWELLLVDDGSSDKGPEIINKLVEKDKRIFSLKRPEIGYKRGGRGAKNYGYLKSKGEFVVFFDADDYMLPNYLQERVTIMLDDSNVDVVFTDFGWKVSSNLIPTKMYTYDPQFNTNFKNLNTTTAFWKSYSDLNIFWVPSNMMWRSCSIKKMRWNEETTIGEDFEFHSQAIILGLRFKYLNKLTWNYMRNESSMMATSDNPLQIGKRSLFMSIVLERLVTSKFLKNTDDLIAHFIKDQYRFIRRIIETPSSFFEKVSEIKLIINRIKIMQKYFENEYNKNYWSKILIKSYFVISTAIILKRGFKMFDKFLIGKRLKNEVLVSQIINVV